MHFRTRWLMMGVLLCGFGARAGAQDVSAIVAQADRERAARNTAAALATLEAGLQTSPASYDLLWRASREAVDMGEKARVDATRTNFFRSGEGYARRAVAANPRDAEGHFVLSVALGRTALSVGSRERVKYATEIRQEALAALRADADHAGALHVLGVWNAEIMRLNSITRFTARRFLGARVFEEASWAEAVRLLERAVQVDPARPTHRLDLAKVYWDSGAKDKARASCTSVAAMPVVESNDAQYKSECASLLARWR
jgi:tetratricopeptide (TPR) repeat protein